jgi:hypothetical protein
MGTFYIKIVVICFGLGLDYTALPRISKFEEYIKDEKTCVVGRNARIICHIKLFIRHIFSLSTQPNTLTFHNFSFKSIIPTLSIRANCNFQSKQALKQVPLYVHSQPEHQNIE